MPSDRFRGRDHSVVVAIEQRRAPSAGRAAQARGVGELVEQLGDGQVIMMAPDLIFGHVSGTRISSHPQKWL